MLQRRPVDDEFPDPYGAPAGRRPGRRRPTGRGLVPARVRAPTAEYAGPAGPGTAARCRTAASRGGPGQTAATAAARRSSGTTSRPACTGPSRATTRADTALGRTARRGRAARGPAHRAVTPGAGSDRGGDGGPTPRRVTASTAADEYGGVPVVAATVPRRLAAATVPSRRRRHGAGRRWDGAAPVGGYGASRLRHRRTVRRAQQGGGTPEPARPVRVAATPQTSRTAPADGYGGGGYGRARGYGGRGGYGAQGGRRRLRRRRVRQGLRPARRLRTSAAAGVAATNRAATTTRAPGGATVAGRARRSRPAGQRRSLDWLDD